MTLLRSQLPLRSKAFRNYARGAPQEDFQTRFIYTIAY